MRGVLRYRVAGRLENLGKPEGLLPCLPFATGKGPLEVLAGDPSGAVGRCVGRRMVGEARRRRGTTEEMTSKGRHLLGGRIMILIALVPAIPLFLAAVGHWQYGLRVSSDGS